MRVRIVVAFVIAMVSNSHILLATVALLLGSAHAFPLHDSNLTALVAEGRADVNVKFYLHTRSNPTVRQELFIGDVASVKNSFYEKSHHTKIIIHGWGGSYASVLNPSVRDAYLALEDFNIVNVDWYEYAKEFYFAARAKVPDVGEIVAEFIDFLHDEFGQSFDSLVVIGHSLGAHVAGYTGKNVKRGKLAAIVGLDPAFPFYVYNDTSTRLAIGDARYIETIQTNGNVKGFLKPIGDASFYPHFGRDQPGCGRDLNGSCSHNRCVNIYVEALRGYSYAPINRCSDYAYIVARDASGCAEHQPMATIGDPLLIERVTGIFYLETNDAAPFGHLTARRV